MVNLVNWFVRGQCIWHDEPIFDRDETGAIFRCPRCLHSWPRLHGDVEPSIEPDRRLMPASARVIASAASARVGKVSSVSVVSAGA
jgi:hypothetical protein